MLPAATALDLRQEALYSLIDVRSPGEFNQGSIPGFCNVPILNDEERHQVGLCYKTQSTEAAVALGHSLVAPFRETRIGAWRERTLASPAGTALLTCWRGGMRSQIAGEWLSATGVEVLRVAGGYKAMRRELLMVLAEPPPLVVVTGLTGSGKTRLLQSLPEVQLVDLEGLAVHRGSSFGAQFGRPQPAQACFENALALALRGLSRPVLVEDESLMIGALRLPANIHAQMGASPLVQVDVPLAQRVRNLAEDYVVEPLTAGLEPDELAGSLIRSTQRLSRRLGGALTMQLCGEIEAAFARCAAQQLEPMNASMSAVQRADAIAAEHAPWLTTVLREYYDKCYHYAASRDKRPSLFRGSFEECRQWILMQYG